MMAAMHDQAQLIQRHFYAETLDDAVDDLRGFLLLDYDVDRLYEVTDAPRVGSTATVVDRLNALHTGVRSNWLTPPEELTEKLSTEAAVPAGKGRELLPKVVSALQAIATRDFCDDAQHAAKYMRKIAADVEDLRTLAAQILDA